MKAIGGRITSQALNDNFSELDSASASLNMEITTIKSEIDALNIPVNLFDKSDVQYGGYISYTNGTPTLLANYYYSGFIPVEPGALYKSTNNEQLAFYDSAQVFLKGAVGALSFVVAPTNAVYVRLSLKSEHLNTLAFYKASRRNLFTPAGMALNNYVNYTTGALSSSTSYQASAYFEVKPSVRYLTANNEQLAFYDENKAFVSGALGGSIVNSNPNNLAQGITSPATAKYVRLSVKNAEVATMALYSTANEDASPDPYKSKVTVGKDGYSDFSTIKSAVTWAKRFAPKKVDIHIKSGEYEEVIDLIGNTNISLIGENKKDCVLVDKSGLYANSPLALSGDTYVKGLTIIANHDGNPSYSSPYSYAVHFDYAGVGLTVFEDCVMKSYQNAAVGIGLHQDQTLKFKNCEFYKDSAYDGGVFYFHNAVASGVTNQNLIVENCTGIAEQGSAIRADDANIGSGDGLGNEMTVTFVGNTFYSKELGLNSVVKNTTPVSAGDFVGNIELDPMSWGNNIGGLNA